MKPDTLYRRLLKYLRPYWWPHFTFAIVCMLLFGATNGVMPFLIRHVFDDVFTAKNMIALKLLPAIIVATFLFRAVVGFGSTYLTEYVGQRIVADIRSALNDHIQHLSLSFFNRTPSATIVSRVANDVAMVRTALTDGVASILKDSTSLVVLIAVAFYQDWFLALIAFIVFPASVLPVIRMSQRLRKFAKRGQESMGNMTMLLQESVQGNRVVKAFGMEDYEQRRFDAENQHLFRLYMKGTRIRALTNPLMEVLAALGIAAVVLYGGYSVIEGGRTQGAFLAFLAAVLLLYDPFKGLAKTNTAVQQAMGAAERVMELLDTGTDVVERAGARVLDGFADAVRFESVSFAYDSEAVLRNIDLEIRRGELVALVGASGGGKSTIADLIPRFYDVQKGRITIDATDIRDVTLASLRAQMAIVTQHTFLFNDTVRNNIAYGGVQTDMEVIVAAARAAHAHDFISELPDGYDTLIGELGLKLSGGQRPRLAIARALLQKAPSFILDEATSALDNESERLVQAALETLMANRTTLVIAHRLSTIRRADRILVVSRGQIVEQGTHDQLLQLNAEYRKLYDLQFSDEPAGAVLQPASEYPE